jgi:diguanylate cyclase (GGDEF)-like protein
MRSDARGLVRKYAFILAGLVAVVLAASSVVAAAFGFEDQRATLEQAQRDRSLVAAERIGAFFRSLDRELRRTDPLGFGDEETRRLQLLRFLRDVPAAIDASYIDPAGTERIFVSRVEPDRIGSGLSRGADPAFSGLRAARAYQGPLRRQDGTAPAMLVAAADAAGGATVATVDIREVIDVLDELERGRLGHAFVVDFDGELIAAPDILSVLRQSGVGRLAQVTAARAAAAQGDLRAQSSVGTDESGRAVLAVTRALQVADWVLVVEEPLDEAYAIVYRSLARAGVILVLGVLASVAAAFVLAHRMARPIEALEHAAAGVAEGRFERIDVAVGAELASLAETFNGMAKAVGEREAELAGMYRSARDAGERLEHQATHDALTGLPNRVLFERRLDEAIARSGDGAAPVALAILDLDRFKEINDTFGHPVGDALLREVGPRLEGALRPGDMVARLGGDEFAVVMLGADANAARGVTERMARRLADPVNVHSHPLLVEASFGIAVYPLHGADATTLLRHADIALYAAKADGSGHTVYTAALDHHSAAALALATELRDAIERDELVLHYQPQIDLASGRIERVEALVRWPHPTRGLIPPAEFIPLAERTGLIKPLTDHVLARAVRECAEWRPYAPNVGVSVNLSARNLLEPELVERVELLLRRYAVDPRLLVLEITESTVMADPERAVATIARLQGIGVRTALDDFGTGYSSLSLLQRLGAGEVKIDRSFVGAMVSDELSATIVRFTVDLGRSLGFQVVAEGVEDEATAAALRALRCPLAQGYHYARAMPLAELLARLAGPAEVRRTA